jgi:hypothetical protein
MTRPRDLDRRAQPGNSCTQDDNRSDRSHLPRDWQTVDADGWVTAAFPARSDDPAICSGDNLSTFGGGLLSPEAREREADAGGSLVRARAKGQGCTLGGQAKGEL